MKQPGPAVLQASIQEGKIKYGNYNGAQKPALFLVEEDH